MKVVKGTIALVSFVGALIIGDLIDPMDTIFKEPPIVALDDDRVNWNVTRSRDPQDNNVVFEIYVRNLSETHIAKNLQAQITLDYAQLDTTFIDALLDLLGEETFWQHWRDDSNKKTPKLRAIAAYIERGKQPPEGTEYEPVLGDIAWDYQTRVPLNIDLAPMESKFIKFEAAIPYKRKGHVADIIIVTSDDHKPDLKTL